MKKLNTLFLLLTITSFAFAQQDINKVVFDKDANQEILKGYCDKDNLKTNPVTYWFLPEYESYSVDITTLELLDSDFFSSLQIKAVMGTWCGDSQREMPRIIKILDYLNYNFENLTIIGVDKNKKAEETEADKLNIEFVPTFIFYNEGMEIGRIIESPIETLGKDMFNIISSI